MSFLFYSNSEETAVSPSHNKTNIREANGHIQALFEKVNGLEQERDDLLEQTRRGNAEIASLAGSIDQLQQSAAQKDLDIKILQLSIAEKDAIVEELNSHSHELRTDVGKDVADLNGTIEGLKINCSVLEEKQSSGEVIIKDLEEKCLSLNEHYEEEIVSLKAERDAQKAEFEQNFSSLSAEFEAKKKEIEQNFSSLSAEFEAKKKECLELVALRCEQTEEMRVKDARLERAEKQISMLQNILQYTSTVENLLHLFKETEDLKAQEEPSPQEFSSSTLNETTTAVPLVDTVNEAFVEVSVAEPDMSCKPVEEEPVVEDLVAEPEATLEPVEEQIQSLPEVEGSGLVGQAVEQTLFEPVIADILEEPIIQETEDLNKIHGLDDSAIENGSTNLVGEAISIPVEAEIEGTLVEVASADGNEPAAVIEEKAPVAETPMPVTILEVGETEGTDALETEGPINGGTDPAIITESVEESPFIEKSSIVNEPEEATISESVNEESDAASESKEALEEPVDGQPEGSAELIASVGGEVSIVANEPAAVEVAPENVSESVDLQLEEKPEDEVQSDQPDLVATEHEEVKAEQQEDTVKQSDDAIEFASGGEVPPIVEVHPSEEDPAVSTDAEPESKEPLETMEETPTGEELSNEQPPLEGVSAEVEVSLDITEPQEIHSTIIEATSKILPVGEEMPNDICPPTSEVASGTLESTQEEAPEETSGEEEPEKLVEVESQNASTDAGAVLNIEVPEVLPDTEKTAVCTVPDSDGPVVMDTPPLTPEGDAEASSKETAPIPSIAQTISEFFV